MLGMVVFQVLVDRRVTPCHQSRTTIFTFKPIIGIGRQWNSASSETFVFANIMNPEIDELGMVPTWCPSSIEVRLTEPYKDLALCILLDTKTIYLPTSSSSLFFKSREREKTPPIPHPPPTYALSKQDLAASRLVNSNPPLHLSAPSCP